jgi:DNA polymerase III sliding clamp (beta) subunit (PCNA family)
MKFEITAGQLRHMLGLARLAMTGTPSLLAYTGIQIVVEGDILQVIGSDGETTIAANNSVDCERTGSTLVLPRPLATFLGTLPADMLLHVSTTDHGDELLVMSAGSAPYRFRTLATTYPQTPLPQGITREVDFTGLGQAVAAVRTAASRDNPVLQIVSSEDDLVLHSTDNYRLVRAEIPGGGFGSFTGVLSLSLMERLAKMDIRAVTIDGSNRLISFSSPQARIVTRVLAVPFPAVESVLSSRPTGAVTLPSQSLLDACSRLASVSDTAPVRCSLHSSGLTLDVTNADLGSGNETVALPEDSTRAPIEFLVRLGYLSDAVSAADAVETDLFYSGPHQPLYFSPTGTERVTTVVMPVRA